MGPDDLHFYFVPQVDAVPLGLGITLRDLYSRAPQKVFDTWAWPRHHGGKKGSLKEVGFPGVALQFCDLPTSGGGLA